LFSFQGQSYKILLKLLLLPQILPTFFSILIAFTIWKPFPLGQIGITFTFILVYLGFATLFLHSAIKEKMNFFGVTSQIFGLSRLSFYRNIFFPILKYDIMACFLFIFIFCFSSFSIPLVAGGGRATNLEMLIYEKIFINQNWSMAWTLSLIQSLFLFSVSILLMSKKSYEKKDFEFSSYLTSSFGVVVLVAYLFVYLAGYFLGLFQSAGHFSEFLAYRDEIMVATFNSIKFLVLFLVLSMVLLYFWILFFVNYLKFNFAQHFIAVSTLLVGFSFYLFFPHTEFWDYIKIPVAILILVFPTLFKSFLEKPLLQLQDQVQVAQVFGLSNTTIVFDVLLSRIKKPLLIWYSILTIWFLCDFAALKAIGTRASVVSLLGESFLSSYRVELAYLLSLYILVIWFAVVFVSTFFSGVIYGVYKKFKFKV
jgi:thiamine transport system permease protein